MRLRYLFVFGCFCFSSSGQTQSNTGEIGGIVRELDGPPIPNAAVSIRNIETNFSRDFLTGTDGGYRAPFLPIGDYVIEVGATGFARHRLSGLALSTGQSFVLEHKLSPATSGRGVSVSAETPMVEIAQSSSSRAIGTFDNRNLPNLARNELQFATLQPFVNANRPREYESPRFDIGGLARRVNYQIDGFENSTSQQKSYRITRLGPAAVDETQILTFGANAEYGRSSGGVINSISRSGSNTAHGQFEYLFSRSAFNAIPYGSSGATKPDADIGAFGLGGPLLQNKLFYFVSNETSRRAFPLSLGFTGSQSIAAAAALGFSGRDTDLLPSSFNPSLWLARLDYQPATRHSITLRANTYREFNNAQGPGGTTILSSSSGALTNTYATAATWRFLIGPSLTHEFRAQIADRYTRRTPYTQPTASTLPSTILTGIATFGVPLNLTANREKIQEVSENIGWTRSSHMFKAGVNAVHSPVFYEDALNPIFVFSGEESATPLDQYLGAIERRVDPSTGQRYNYSQLTLSFGTPRIDYKQTYLGGYLQDSWRPRPNLTINFGIRYETMYVPRAPSNAPHPLSRNIPADRMNLAPRLGIAWSPRRNPKLAIRASYGVHFDPPQGNAFRNSLIENSLNEVSVEIAGNSRGAPVYPFYPRVLSGLIRTKPSLSVISPDFQWMHAQQIQVAIVRQLTGDLSISLQYAFLRGSKIPALQNINLDPNSSLGTLADGRPIYGPSRLDPNFNNIVILTSAGNSNYNGFGLNVSKRFRRYTQFNVSYTWSHALDNAPEVGISGGSEQAQDTYNRRAEYGNSLTDVRHVLNSSAIFSLRNFQLSTFLSARSGSTYDVRAGADLNRDGNPNDRPLYYGRNVGKGPASAQLDARFSRFLDLERVRPRARLEAFAESANVFNTPIPDSTNAFLNRTNFTILSWQEMRRVELGFRLLF